MRVTSKGQVTIPREVRDAMGIHPADTEVEFRQDEQGRWYLAKLQMHSSQKSRFRKAHESVNIRMTTDEIMALTRSEQ